MNMLLTLIGSLQMHTYIETSHYTPLICSIVMYQIKIKIKHENSDTFINM
jgi:hypothetical protein